MSVKTLFPSSPSKLIHCTPSERGYPVKHLQNPALLLAYGPTMQLVSTWHRFRSWLAGKTSRRVDKFRRPRRLSFDRLEDRSMLAFAPELVRDINLVTGANGSSSPSSFVAVGGITFFTAADAKMALNSGKRTARVRDRRGPRHPSGRLRF